MPGQGKEKRRKSAFAGLDFSGGQGNFTPIPLSGESDQFIQGQRAFSITGQRFSRSAQERSKSITPLVFFRR